MNLVGASTTACGRNPEPQRESFDPTPNAINKGNEQLVLYLSYCYAVYYKQ